MLVLCMSKKEAPVGGKLGLCKASDIDTLAPCPMWPGNMGLLFLSVEVL